MEKINVGLIGFGTVGTGVVRVLKENARVIADRLGSEVVLKTIADTDVKRDRGVVRHAQYAVFPNHYLSAPSPPPAATSSRFVTSSKRQRLVRLIGRHSSIRTVSPTCDSFFSS